MKHTSWTVLQSGNTFALARRISISRPDEWGLFGGSNDKDEKPDAAAQRELFEEAGLEVDISRFEPIGNLVIGTHTLHVYKVQTNDPVFTLNPEHKSVSWFTQDIALNIPLHWCAKQILTKLPL